jgi:hypothetical protein
MTEIEPDIDGWARSHGFQPSKEEIAGATPLLRLGFLDVTDDVYRGLVGDHEALLAEFSVGSPGWSEAFGGGGADFTLFTLMLVGIDAHLWPRLTVHPTRFSDHDWTRRILHKDHQIHTVSPQMDSRYRVIASNAIPTERLQELFTSELESWWLAQSPEPIVDIEDHPLHGGYLTVAHLGLPDGDRDLDALQLQTGHLLSALSV